MRGPEAGGAPGGTPEIYVTDADGLVVQLQDPRYCGGAGALGNVCSSIEAAPKKGLIPLAGWSHLTMFVPDAKKSNAFYQDLFGMGIRSYQGPTAPTLAAGGGVEFLMYTGGGGGNAGAPPRPASINHFCLNLERFNVEQIQKALESVGIKPRDSQTPGPVGPMRHYVSMRMPNRGGAPEGTPELYFTDPDGLLVQLQDVKYCGGSGVLGDVCPPGDSRHLPSGYDPRETSTPGSVGDMRSSVSCADFWPFVSVSRLSHVGTSSRWQMRSSIAAVATIVPQPVAPSRGRHVDTAPIVWPAVPRSSRLLFALIRRGRHDPAERHVPDAVLHDAELDDAAAGVTSEDHRSE